VERRPPGRYGVLIHCTLEGETPNILDDLDPADRAIVEYGKTHSPPRPESQAIRAHVPAVLHAFTQAWRTTFLDGILDHHIKELCRVYVSQSIECDY